MRSDSRVIFAADGCLITSALFGLLTAISLGLDELFGIGPIGGEFQTVPILIVSIIIWLLGVAGFVAGPLVAWFIYKRHLSGMAIVGAFLGYAVSGIVVGILLGLSMLAGWFVHLFIASEYAGSLVIAALVSLAFVVLMILLAIDAVRDLSSEVRQHVRLDIVRLISVLAIIGFAIGTFIYTTVVEGVFDFEALLFLVIAGIGGASIVTVADVFVKIKGRKPSA